MGQSGNVIRDVFLKCPPGTDVGPLLLNNGIDPKVAAGTLDLGRCRVGVLAQGATPASFTDVYTMAEIKRYRYKQTGMFVVIRGNVYNVGGESDRNDTIRGKEDGRGLELSGSELS